MKTVDEHLARHPREHRPLAPLELQLLDAQGCILAEDVTADGRPAALRQLLDGRLRGARRRRRGASEDAPGRSCRSSATSRPGSSRRYTRAARPDRADHDRRAGARRRRRRRPGRVDRRRASPRVQRSRAGARGRRSTSAARGEDVRAGDVGARRRRPARPGQLGLLAAVGRDRVVVRPRPRVVVISTGSELVEPGSRLAPGQIYDSTASC